MRRIPKFKNRDEARKFWETHSFADYVDDTEDMRVQDDSNSTRSRTWPVHVYLQPEEAIGLDEMARRMGEAKNHILRRALRNYMELQSKSIGFNPLEFAATYLHGISLSKVSSKIQYAGVEFFSDNPTRDSDLAKKLKSILMVALPHCKKIEVMIRRIKEARSSELLDLLAHDADLQGELTYRERAKVKHAIKTVAKRAIGKHLASRHTITERA